VSLFCFCFGGSILVVCAIYCLRMVLEDSVLEEGAYI
jgi:hypothetical protein